MKVGMITVSALALMALPAFAQEPLAEKQSQPGVQAEQPPMAPSSKPEPLAMGLRKSNEDGKMVGQLGATVDKVEEMDVYDAAGNKIAEVDSVLEDTNGEIKGLAIGYGGFLGFGEKGAILTFDHVKQKDGNIVVDMTEDQLPSLPAWDN